MLRTSLLLSGFAAVLTTTTTTAQVQPGDIVATGFSSSAFGVLRGTAITAYTTTGFQGTGAASSQAILWDPANPNDFLIGGFGFVGRATILGGGSVSYSLITNNVGIVSQMSWDDNGGVIVVDSGSNEVSYLDPIAGTVVDLSTGTQPWGTDLGAGARDPITGDIICGGNGGLYRLTIGSAVAVPIVTGLGGVVSGIAFDPVTGEIVATVLTANRLIRVDSGITVTDIAPPFSIPGPNALAVDQNGDFIAGGGTGQMYRVLRAGGSPVFLANNTSPFGNVNGLAVAYGSGFGIPFGQGCSGAAGIVELTASGPFLVGSPITTSSSNHAPNTIGLEVLGLSNSDYLGLPLPFLLDPLLGTSGCSLYASADVTLAAIADAGNPATLSFVITPNASFSGQRLYVQHVGLEAVAGGLSFSNGLVIRVP